MTQRRLTAYFFLLLTSIIWGIAGPVIKFTLTSFPPLIFLSYRFAISSFVALIFFVTAQPKLPRKSSLITLLIIAGFLTSTVRLGLLFAGFNETTSLSGNVISAITPALLALLGHYFFHEHVTAHERIGLLIAFFGTMVSVVEPVFAADSTFVATLHGNLLVLISLFADVISIMLIKYLLKRQVEPGIIPHLTFLIGFLTIIPLTFYYHSWSQVISTIVRAPLEAHLGVLFMALISGTLAYGLQAKGLKSIEVGEASVFSYLSPVWAAPLSLLWLHEKISGPFLFGAALIFIGVMIAEYKRRTN